MGIVLITFYKEFIVLLCLLSENYSKLMFLLNYLETLPASQAQITSVSELNQISLKRAKCTIPVGLFRIFFN